MVTVLGNTSLVRAHEPGPATTPVQPGKKLPRYATIVESRRPPLLASQRVIGARELSVAPRRRSADDLLRLVPGVFLSQHGSEGKGQQIFLRGFDAVHGQDVEVTVAGIPINELSNIHGQGYIDLNFVIPEVVRQVSASKGPFLLNQGNFANAGTIRFDLGVDPANRGTRTSYEFGSTLRHRGVVVLAPKQLRRENFVAFEAMHDRGFAAGRRASRASSIGQVRLVDSKEYGHLDLFGTGYYAKFSSPGAVTATDVADGSVPFAGAYQNDWGGSSIRGIASLRHEIDVGRGKLDQRLYGQIRRFDILENFTGYLQDAVRGDRRLQTHDFLSAGYQIEYTRPIVDSLVLVAGGAWQGDRVAQRDEQVDANHGVVSKNWDLGVGQNQAHARTGLRWRPSDWFYTEGGARVDMFAYDVIDHVRDDARTKKVLARVSPRLLTSFRISERWSLFASYGRGFRAPEARSILGGKVTPSDVELDRYKGGTPRIFPSDAVEVGGRFTGRKYFYAGVALFGTWVDRELVFDHVSAVNLELNKTRRLGAEVDLGVRPTEWLELRQDLTLAHGRFVASGAPIPGAPPLLSATTLTLIHPRGYRAGARLQVVGSRALPYGARSATYALLDLSVGYRTGPLQLDIQIDNATNAQWKEGEYHYASWWDKDEPRSTLPSLKFIAGPPLTVRTATTLWF
ncbi:MAG: TonB-dependent receptor [Myxococcales bacterium]|nr:TonB-dependent receptor [Myxococcales bacterium]